MPSSCLQSSLRRRKTSNYPSCIINLLEDQHPDQRQTCKSPWESSKNAKILLYDETPHSYLISEQHADDNLSISSIVVDENVEESPKILLFPKFQANINLSEGCEPSNSDSTFQLVKRDSLNYNIDIGLKKPNFERLFPELWLNIISYCPQETIYSMLRVSKWFYDIIDKNEHVIQGRQVASEIVIVLKVEVYKLAESLKFLEAIPFEYFINGRRFKIYFRITNSILLHMDFCVKFRGKLNNNFEQYKEDVDKEPMRIMRFPVELQNYLRKRGNMQKYFRPHFIKLNDKEKEAGMLWNHFVTTKVLSHTNFILKQKQLFIARPIINKCKGLRWYLSHSGFESLPIMQKLQIATELCDILLSHEQCKIKSNESIKIQRIGENAIGLIYTKSSKYTILNSIIGKSKPKETKIPIPNLYWDTRKGEFWYEGIYRFIVQQFITPIA